MVMGGYDADSEGYSQTYLFSVEGDNYIIKDLNTFPLPSAEAFWTNNPIIQNKRRILTFDGSSWNTYHE